MKSNMFYLTLYFHTFYFNKPSYHACSQRFYTETIRIKNYYYLKHLSTLFRDIFETFCSPCHTHLVRIVDDSVGRPYLLCIVHIFLPAKIIPWFYSSCDIMPHSSSHIISSKLEKHLLSTYLYILAEVTLWCLLVWYSTKRLPCTTLKLCGTTL